VPGLWWRMVLLALAGLALSYGVSHTMSRSTDGEVPGLQNPFEIRPAVGFAILFVLLSVLTNVVNTHLGDSGVLALAALVGVTDITPFIMSIVHGTDSALRVVTSATVLALMSNTVAKGIYFAVLEKTLRKETIWRYGVWTILHVPLIVF
jgi:uncharacterized membrane protein (DUF4010 family)